MSVEDWTEIQDSVFTLYGQGRLREALAEADGAALAFPDRLTRTSYWRACLHSVLGETHEALDVLKDAVDRGAWWSDVTLRNEVDLASVRDLPEFQTILRVCADLNAAAAGKSRPELVILQPNRVEGASLPALLLALHSRGATAQAFARNWEPAVDSGVMVAIPQSSQMCASDQYCWDDEAKAAVEVEQVYARVAKECRFDPDRVVLAGASQGGRLAIQTCLRGGTFSSRGFIVVVPALRDVSEFGALSRAAADRGVRGYMVVGDKDRFYQGACDLHEAMKASGLPCFLDVRQGMGHRFPPDFSDILPRALEFVLG